MNDFTCQYDDIAIDLTNVSYILLFQNDLTSYNYHAAQLTDCNNGFIAELDILNKRINGIILNHCENIYVTSTSFKLAQQEGFYVNDSINIAIEDCTFTDNLIGIGLGDNSIVEILDNNYIGNEFNIYHAIYLDNQDIHYSELQYAIDLAEIGVDVYIYPGNYTENVIVNKTISLHGLVDIHLPVILCPQDAEFYASGPSEHRPVYGVADWRLEDAMLDSNCDRTKELPKIAEDISTRAVQLVRLSDISYGILNTLRARISGNRTCPSFHIFFTTQITFTALFTDTPIFSQIFSHVFHFSQLKFTHS